MTSPNAKDRWMYEAASTPATKESFAALWEEGRGAISDGVMPHSLALDEALDALASDEDLPPGLATATGIVTERATEAERMEWERWCSQAPELSSLANACEEWLAGDVTDEIQILLARGEDVAATLPPTPSLASLMQAQPMPDAPELAGEMVLASDEHFATTTSASIELDEPAEESALSAPVSADAWRWPTYLSAGMGMMLAFVALWWGSMDGVLQRSSVEPSGKSSYIEPGPWTTTKKGGVIAAKQEMVPDGSLPSSLHSGESWHFRFFVRQGKPIQEVAQTYRARPGDQLRFFYRYTAPEGRASKTHYLLLFMVDQGGQISHLYPADPHGRFVLRPHRGTFLPTGATLDSIKGPERLYACVSRRPLPYKDVKRALKRALKTRHLHQIKRLSGPCVYQRSWLLLPAK